jgi:hypothetical protein
LPGSLTRQQLRSTETSLNYTLRIVPKENDRWLAYIWLMIITIYRHRENSHQDSFKAMILAEDWPDFSPALDALFPLDQVVMVSGEITWYQGDPIILLYHAKQIQ